MRRLSYSRAALSDLDGIDEIISGDDPARARAYVADIMARCRVLCRHPYLGPSRDRIGAGIRVLPFRRRVMVAYRINPDAIHVERVYFGGRQY